MKNNWTDRFAASARCCAFAAFALLAFVQLSSLATAATFYVRADGNNANSGTGPEANNAWASIDFAANSGLAPGDIVLVRAGTYTERVLLSVDGTAAAPIQFIADTRGVTAGWRPGVVLLQAPSDEECFDIRGDDHIHIIGFTMDGDPNIDAIYVSDSEGIFINRCEIFGGRNAIRIDTNAEVFVSNCLLRDNDDNGILHLSGTLNVENITAVENSDDGIDIHAGTVSIINSIIVENGDDGIDVEGGSITRNSNLLFDNGNNNLEGTSTAPGEIFVNPQFVDNDEDFHLRSTSPAINAGTTGSATTDFHSNSRSFNGGIDLGYHEYASTLLNGTQLLFITQNNGFFGAEERVRKSFLEAWGYTVNFIHSGDTQANYNAALANVDVVYVPEEVLADDVGHKLRETTVGVFFDEDNLSDEFGLSTDASGEGSQNTITITDNTQFITEPFSTNPLLYASPQTEASSFSGTLAPDLRILASWGSSPSLGIIDAGQTLVNTFNGSNIAFGRRVGFPHEDDFHWADLTDDGLTLLERSLIWATGLGGNLVGHWKLDETSGNTAFDSSGSGRDGTLTGTLIQGIQAPRRTGYTGVNGRVEIADHNSFDLTSEVTIAAWIRVDQFQTIFETILAKGDTTYRLSRNNTTSTLHFALNDFNTPATYAEVSSTTAIDDGRWHHVVARYDGSTAEIWVDGRLEASVNTTVPISTNNEPLWIGDNSQRVNREWSGDLDDVRLYRRAISDEEIAELCGLLGHWRLNETAGTIATDSSGLSNNGTYANGATPGGAGPYPGAGAVAATLNGGNNQVALPTLEYDYSDGATIALWYNLDTLSGGGHTDLFSISNGASDNNLWLGIDSTNGLELSLSDPIDGGAALREINEGASPATGNWQHVVATIDGSGNAILYRNGQVVGSGFVGLPAELLRTQNRIGQSTLNHGTDGRIFDVRLYNRRLFPYEIAQLYGLVGHWKLDEVAGLTAADTSGSAFDGTHTGGVQVNAEGPYPNEGAIAAGYDGSNDHTDLPNIQLDYSNGLAMTCWVRPDDTPASGQTQAFLSLSNGSNADEIWIGGVGLVGFQLYTTDLGDGASLRTVEDNTDLAPGRWTHYVASVDSLGNASLYRNGELVKSGFIGNFTNIRRSQNAIATSAINGFFPGDMHDVRLYNRPLSELEVADLYGLVGHWRFNEGSGNVVADSTAFGNDATVNGATWSVECDGNTSLEFDGAGTTATTNSAFDPPPTGSVAFWMRGELQSVRERIFGVSGDWEARIEPAGNIVFDLGASPDINSQNFASNVSVDDNGRWYHIVVNYNSADDTFEVYIDGELDASGISSTDLTDQAPGILTFGTRTGNNEFWRGALRDFRVYDRWLGQGEIADLTGVLAHWRFDETSGTVAADSSAAGNDATYIGSPTLGLNGVFPVATANSVGLNGTDQSISSGRSLLSNLERFAIAGWIRPDSNSPSQSFFGQNGAIELGIDSTANQINLTTTGGGSVSATQILPPGKWTHVIATGNGNQLTLYIDGVAVATGGFPTTNYGSSSADTKVGEGVIAPVGNHYDGRIDEVHLFSRAICPEEANGLYRDGRAPGVRIRRWVEIR